MIVSIIPIGNSKGIRLPKTVIDQLEIKDKVSLEVAEGKIILKPLRKNPREGWENAFIEMRKHDDDALLIDDISDEGTFQWEW